MLLAAGLSTRLGPLGDERPKPMLPMVDVPLIRYGQNLLKRAGVETIGVNLHHHGDQIHAELGDEVTYSEEAEILGTGGGIKRLAETLGGDRFVVVNAKVVIDLSLLDAIDAHLRRGAVATMVVRPDADARRWGAIDVGHDGRVRGMLGDGRHMFTGVHILEREFIESIPRGPCDIVRTAYAEWVARGGPIFVCEQAEASFFAENSTVERYLDANMAMLGCGAPFPWPTFGVDATAAVDAGAHVDRSSRVGPHARVERGARIERSVVGRGAVVAEGVQVSGSVIWPGAVVDERVRGAIVTPRQRVQVHGPA